MKIRPVHSRVDCQFPGLTPSYFFLTKYSRTPYEVRGFPFVGDSPGYLVKGMSDGPSKGDPLSQALSWVYLTSIMSIGSVIDELWTFIGCLEQICIRCWSIPCPLQLKLKGYTRGYVDTCNHPYQVIFNVFQSLSRPKRNLPVS